VALRVVQWATGGVGKAAIEGIVKHPDLELVGCWVHAEQKNGVDVGEIVGLPALGVRATTSAADIFALEADAVVYAPIVPHVDDVAALLRSGIGITELHPLMFSALSSAVTYLRGEEFSDIRTYNAPDVVRWIMCFGATPEDAMNSPMLKLLSGGFIQSVQMCLDVLGFAASAQIRTHQEVAVATAPIESPIGTIEPGLVAAQRFQWEAVVGSDVVVRIAVNWLMGEENLDPAWTFGAAGERFEVEVQGDPDCFVTIKGWQPASVEAGLVRNPGIVATAMHCVNSIPYVCAAPPGIRTYVDLPLIAGRAHPDLAR
jgi:2,4-diaminopentanoate dehydrogenase